MVQYPGEKRQNRSFYDTFPLKIFMVPKFYEQEAEKLSKKWVRD